MAVVVYYLNRQLPLEGGLYVWARTAFGDTGGFLVAWNLWAYGLSTIATILFQIPTEFAYMVGPSAAWIPENHAVVLTALSILMLLIALAAFRGLALGKWIHNFGAIGMMAAFALLIIAPLRAWLHHAPIQFTPFELHLPAHDPTSLSLLGQILFASAGLEYVAILAGESKSPGRNIGRSVLWASPIIVVMFVFGTASVLAFHELTHSTINYVAPIPQTLRLAFGNSGFGDALARCTILLLQFRILGTSSFIFTGVTRLPMAAGWDHLAPAWFSRLHPRYRTPTHSIFFAAAAVILLIFVAGLGVQAKETFALLNNGSNELYGLAYMAMFAVPIIGAPALRKRMPRWVAWVCVAGFLSVLFSVALSCYPFLDVPDPTSFAIKILAFMVLTNLIGYILYRLRRKPTI
jgi:amino acid transporter